MSHAEQPEMVLVHPSRGLPLVRGKNQPSGVVDTLYSSPASRDSKLGGLSRIPVCHCFATGLSRACSYGSSAEDIISKYKEVLTRLDVRRNLVGEVINLLREEAEIVDFRMTGDASPDPDDNSFVDAQNRDGPPSLQL